MATIAARIGLRRHDSVLPGFRLTLGLTLAYLGLIVLLPLSALIIKSTGLGWSGFVDAAFTARALAAYKLSFATALTAGAINVVFGVIVAWVLVRYEFPGKRLIDAVVDLPFALPTAVAGIALATIYARNGWVGAPLSMLGIVLAFTLFKHMTVFDNVAFGLRVKPRTERP